MDGGDGSTALEHALHDGEDFELCLVVAPEDAGRLLADPPSPAKLYRVGRIEQRAGLRLRLADGQVRNIEAGGFDHFRSRR
jgi:thiamine-monophosphate kinase